MEAGMRDDQSSLGETLLGLLVFIVGMSPFMLLLLL
jgi:hypothetical protein